MIIKPYDKKFPDCPFLTKINGVYRGCKKFNHAMQLVLASGWGCMIDNTTSDGVYILSRDGETIRISEWLGKVCMAKAYHGSVAERPNAEVC